MAGLIIAITSILTIFSGTALALSTCFTAPRANEPLYVSPYTTVCGTDGTKTYVDLSGRTISAPLDGKCYVGRTTPNGGSMVYKQETCADLNALFLASKQNACTGSGGTWENSGCKCPIGQAPDSFTAACKATASNTTAPIDLQGDGQKIYDRLTQAINALSALVGIVIVISIIMGGIQYAASGGDPQKVSAGKERILNAIVAFFVFIFLYAFLQYIVPGGVF